MMRSRRQSSLISSHSVVDKFISFILTVAMVTQTVPVQGVAFAVGLSDDPSSDGAVSEVTDAKTEDVASETSSDVNQLVLIETSGEPAVEPVSDPEPVKVKFVFDANGPVEGDKAVVGSMDMFEFVMDGQAHALPKCLYQREDYVFSGWSLTKDGNDIPDNPETVDVNESFSTLHLVDGLEMIDLGYDETVEEKQVDDAGNEVIVSKVVPRNLEYAVKNGEIKLYAQWAEVQLEVADDSQNEGDLSGSSGVQDVSENTNGSGKTDVDLVDDGVGEKKDPVEKEGSSDDVDNKKKTELNDDVVEKSDKSSAVDNQVDVKSSDDLNSGSQVRDESSDKKDENVSDDKNENDFDKKSEKTSDVADDSVNVNVTVSDDGPEALVVEGEGTSEDTIADAVSGSSGLSRDRSLGMARKVSGVNLRGSAPANDLPRQLDGSNIEGIAVRWVTEDTVDDGDDSRLYLKPESDDSFSVMARLNYALSGEHDYEAGDVTITIPAELFKNRDGSDAGTWVIPYPEEPKRTDEFMWSRVGDTYVFKNTRRMEAATKGYIEVMIDDLVPHKLVDMAETEPFWARIEVATHLGNTIGLTSDEIVANVDTEEQVTSATKWGSSANVEIVSADEIPAAARVGNESEYVLVTWSMNAYINGNTEFTLDMLDTKVDNYVGTIVYPDVVANGYTTRCMTGYSRNGMAGYKIVKVAYPLSQFDPDTTYTFENDVLYTLTEVDDELGDDPQLETTAYAHATIDWGWSEPEYIDPVGHFMVKKYGNDGVNGHNSSPYYSHNGYSRQDTSIDNENGWYGIYPSALNDLVAGDDVELAWTVQSIGYLLPWTLDGDPRVISNFGRRNVRMVTYDGDETQASNVYLFGGRSLSLGTDYEYKAVEFPKRPTIYKANAVNLNPDGSFVAMSAGDGTVDYALDYDDSHVPTVRLEAKVNGVWTYVATADWTSGSLHISDGMSVGNRVMLPQGTEQIRTIVDTNIAGIYYYIRPIFTIKASGLVGTSAAELFERSNVPSLAVYNTTYMKAFDDDDVEIVDIRKQERDLLQGYSTDVGVYPYKSFEQKSIDVDNRQVLVHYSVSVEERSLIPDVVTYRDAIADNKLMAETEGVFYDLLPKGMTPITSSVALRSKDSVVDVQTFENWRGTGRILLMVKAQLSVNPEKYNSDGGVYRYMDKPTLSFDASYSFDSLRDYGSTVHNVVAYESLSREPLGTISNMGAEPDDPRSSNNEATARAFANDVELDALTGLDTDHSGDRFVYAGCYGEMNVPSAARTSLSKDVQVNGDGVWSAGTYDDDRDVYEGGQYQYRLRMMSDVDTDSKDLILYDSLENFYAAQGNDEVDINAPRWRGTLRSVDVSQLVDLGVAPVVYYSTVDNLLLADETNPRVANTTNMNLNDSSIWVKASDYTGSLSAVHAIAVDCRKMVDGSDFVLEPLESCVVLVNMQAPYGEAARTYISQKGVWGDSAHAYNNAYLTCASIDHELGVGDSDNFIRHDYTKVGLDEFALDVNKTWDDDNDRDGIRPESVTVHLLANGADSGQELVLSGPDWSGQFTNIPYCDHNGEKIVYSVQEDLPNGYTSKLIRDGATFSFTNTHDVETVSVSGHKTWMGGEDVVPAYISVYVYADEDVAKILQVTPGAGNDWAFSVNNLPKYRDHGTEIEYSVREVGVSNVWVETCDGYEITNTYHPYGDLMVTKQALGQTTSFTSTRFPIQIHLYDAEGSLLEGDFAYETSDGREGRILSGGVIELAGSESVTVHELPVGASYELVEDEVAGYSTVVSNGEGTIVANETVQATVTNTYSAKGFVNFQANKVLNGRELKQYQFRGEVLDENDELLRSVTNRADGSMMFGAINYTQADVGEHVYTICETNMEKPGYTYDSQRYTATVTVSDNGNGTLSCDVVYTDSEGEQVDVPVFTNTYSASGSVRLKAWKDLQGRDLTANEFSFELLDEDGERVGNIVHNDADGEVLFDQMNFTEQDAGRVLKFIAHEIVGNDATVTYSDKYYGYQITVFDNGDGTLGFAQDMLGVLEVEEPIEWTWGEATDLDHHTYQWYTPWGEYGLRGLANVSQSAMLTSLGLSQSDVMAVYVTNTEILNENDIWPFMSAGFTTGMSASYWDQVSDLETAVSTAGTTKAIGLVLNDMGVQHVYDSIGVQLEEPIVTLLGSGSYEFFSRGFMHSTLTFTLDKLGTQYQFGNPVDAAPVFVNSLSPGSLKIEKHVDNVPEGHEDDLFRFKVKLSGANVPDSLEYEASEIETNNEPDVGSDTSSWFESVGSWLMSLVTPQVAYADEGDIAGGTYDDVDWRITSDYELIIGDGTEQTFTNKSSRSQTDWPWSLYRTNITNITINGIVHAQGNMSYMFYGFTNITTPNLLNLETSNVTNMSNMFYNCTNSAFNPNVSNWNTSNVTNMSGMFYYCSGAAFNPNISNWNVSSVTNMSDMFHGCSGRAFNPDVSNWDVSHVTNMYYMFGLCSGASFNPDVSLWNTSSVTNMSFLFDACSGNNFNPAVSNWDVSHVTNMRYTFSTCYGRSFNPDVSAWDISSVWTVESMFSSCYGAAFNPDVSNWDVSRLTSLNSMFENCHGAAFNPDISNWDVSHVTNMYYAFANCGGAAFNPDVSNWDVSHVTSMYYMFGNCHGASFNPDVSNWDVSHVTNMYGVFSQCYGVAFNPDVSNWNTSNVTNMYSMFYGCYGAAFNPDISNWDVSHVTDMSYMFCNCHGAAFNPDVSGWNTSSVTNMFQMFKNCYGDSFVSIDISNWDTSSVTTVNYCPSFEGCSNLRELTVSDVTRISTSFPTHAAQDGYSSDWDNFDLGAYGVASVDMVTEINEGRGAGTWVWAMNGTVLQFDSNGGVGYMPNQTVFTDEPDNISANKFMRFNYSFDCWNTEPDGTGVSYADREEYTSVSSVRTVTLYAQWKPSDGLVTVEDNEFEVVLPANYEVTIVGLPAGVSYSVFEESLGGWLLVSQSGTSGTIGPNQLSMASFTNRYDVGHATASIAATKLLNGQLADAGAFSFELRENDQLIERVSNSAGGAILFAPLEYDEYDVGVHTYTISEVRGNDSDVFYDNHIEVVTVEVRESDGNLGTIISYDADGAQFDNVSLPGSLQITKDTGDYSGDQEFEFEVTLKNTPVDNAGYVREEDVEAPVDTVTPIDIIGELFLPRTAYAEESDSYMLTFNAGDGTFSNGTTQNVVTTTFDSELVTKYSHTPNISDDGTQNGNYANSLNLNKVVTIPGASSLTVQITYATESTSYDWACVWSGSHSNYTASNNYGSSISGKLGGTTKTTKTYTITGDTVTFGFRSDGSINNYGYYAVVTGMSTVVTTTGDYEEPVANDVSKHFYGWQLLNGDYVDDVDELDETTELTATYSGQTVTYKANGGSGADIVDDVVNNYVIRDEVTFSKPGYRCVGWNTAVDGSGISYPVGDDDFGDSSLVLFAQWVVVGPLDGYAYAVLDEDGVFTFFRSDRVYANNAVQTVTDFFGNSYTGRVFTGFEDVTVYSSSTEVVWKDYRSSIRQVSIADYQMIKPKITARWFYQSYNLGECDLSQLDVSDVTDMHEMFYVCYDDDFNPDVSTWDTSNVTNMSKMFYSCGGDSFNPDVSNWDFSSLTNSEWMFYYCDGALFNPDVSHWDLSVIDSLYYTFWGCSGDAFNPDVSNWDLSNMTAMHGVFGYCNGVSFSPDVSNWDTSHITDMNSLFLCAQGGVFNPDVSNWDVSNVTDMTALFEYCYSAFGIGNSLVGPDVSNWDVSNVVTMDDIFSGCSGAAFNPDISNWDTSSVTSFYEMFRGCSGDAFNPDVSNWDTSSVYCTNRMFEDCSGASFNPDVSNWDTHNVNMMYGMFSNCSGDVFNPDVSNWDISNVTAMPDMFNGCSGESFDPDVSRWDTSSLEDFRDIFANCGLLESLDISNWDWSWAVIDSFARSRLGLKNCSQLKKFVVSADTVIYPNDFPSHEAQGIYKDTWDNLELGLWDVKSENVPEIINSGLGAGTWVWSVNDNTARVKFDGNGGTVVGTDTVVQENEVSAVSLPHAVNGVRRLVGWNTDPYGKGDEYQIGGSVTPVLGQTIVLYAQWADSDQMATYTVTTWYENIDNLGTYDVAGVEERRNYVGRELDIVAEPVQNFDTPETVRITVATDDSDNVVLYYTRTRSTVYLDGNGYTSSSQMDFVGGIRRRLPTPAPVEGMYFVGWCENRDGSGMMYGAGMPVGFSEDKALYAIYADVDSAPEQVGLDSVIRVKVKAGETVTIPNIPAGTSYTVREVNVPNYWREVSMENGSGTVGTDETVVVTSHNEYLGVCDIELSVVKFMYDDAGDRIDLSGGEFAFEAYEITDMIDFDNYSSSDVNYELSCDRLVSTAQNEATDKREYISGYDGEPEQNYSYGGSLVMFDPIRVTTPGVHYYVLHEVVDNNSKVEYDAEDILVYVSVYDRDDGSLGYWMSYENNKYEFENYVKRGHEILQDDDVEETGSIALTKYMGNTPVSDDEDDEYQFVFGIDAVDENNEPVDGLYRTVAGDQGGSGITIYHTSNLDDNGNKLEDVSAGEWHVGVIHVDGAESLLLDCLYMYPYNDYFYSGLYFTIGDHLDDWQNYYPDYSYDSYYDYDQFDTLVHEVVEIPSDTVTVMYMTSYWDGSTVNPDSSKSHYGLYVKAVGNNNVANFVNGHADVTVAGDSTLTITGLPEGTSYSVTEQSTDGWILESSRGNTGMVQAVSTNNVTLTNRYVSEGTFSVNATKSCVGIDLSQQSFDFVLSDADDQFVARASTDASGNIVFDNLPIDSSWAGTTRTYHVQEVCGNDDHILYDSHVEDVTVTFVDDGAGHLTGTVSYDNDGCRFENKLCILMPGTGLGGIPVDVIAYAVMAVVLGMSVHVLRSRRKSEKIAA